MAKKKSRKKTKQETKKPSKVQRDLNGDICVCAHRRDHHGVGHPHPITGVREDGRCLDCKKCLRFEKK